MKSRLLAGIAAAVLAVIGAILIFAYAQGADERAVQNLEPIDVLIVQQPVPAGTAVEALAASVATERLPAAAVAGTSLKTLDDSTGLVTAVDLLPGEQLLAERLIAPEDVETPGAIEIPEGLQEVSFQLEPQRVVGGRLTAGEHVGIFMSLSEGALADEADKETTKLVIKRALITAVQRAPQAAASAEPTPPPEGEPVDESEPEDTSLPTGALLLTVAVSDSDASKIVFASEFASMWLSKAPADVADGEPRVIQKTEIYR